MSGSLLPKDPGTATARGPRMDAVTALAGFIVLLFAIPSSLGIGPLGSAGAPATVIGIIGFLWWSWYHVQRAEFRRGGVQPVRWAIAAFLLSVAISYVWAMARPLPADEVSPADSGLLRVVSLCGIALVANDGIRSLERMRQLVRFVVAAAAAVSALSILQVATGRLWVDRIAVPGLVHTAVMDLGDRAGLIRPSGTASHPLEFASVLAMTFPLAIMYVKGKGRLRPLYAVLLSCLFLGVLLSLSRTAILCLAIGLVFILPTLPRSWRIAGGIGAVALTGVLYVTVPGIVGTLRGMFLGISGDPSVQSRTDSYALVAEFIGRSPIVGRGLGTFLPKYWILDNMYLQILIELGMVGLLALLAVFVSAIVCALSARRSTWASADKDLATGVAAGVSAGAVSLAFFDTFAFPQSAFVLFLLVGMAGAYRRLATVALDH